MHEVKHRRTGSLQRERNGTWTMRVSHAGKIYSRTSGTDDSAKAKMSLAKFVVAVECEHSGEAAHGALINEWARYEESADAARLSARMRGNRYRALREFSAWMKFAHPEVERAGAVTRQMAEEYMNFFGEGRSAMTFNLNACSLRRVFRVLLGGSGEVVNPWDGVASRLSDTHPRRELTIDEVRRVIVAAEEEGGEWPCLIAIAVYTGLRLGDCCRLRWECVNLAQGIIQVVPHKTRRYACGRVATIPIHEQLMSALVATAGVTRSGYVLPGIAEKYETSRWRITKGIDRIFEGAGIVKSVMYEGRSRLTPFATFHSLRHSFVSFAANAGVPLVVVQAIVGHASTAMTHHYYHANESALRRAVNAIPSFGRGGKPMRKCGDGEIYRDALRGFDACGCRLPSVAQRLTRADRLLRGGLITSQEHFGLRERILADA